MANVVKKGTASPVSGNPVILNGPSLDTLSPPTTSQMAPLIAGEAIGQYAPCHISAVDGKVYMSYGGGATAYLNSGTPLGSDPAGYTNATLAKVHGWAAEQVLLAGEPVTLQRHVVVDWCNVAQTCGTNLFVSGTVVGGLDDAASTYGTVPAATVWGESPAATTTTKILVHQLVV